MTLVKFNRKPYDGGFNNLVDNLFGEFPAFFKNEQATQWKGFVPVNIDETEKAYKLEVVAPGFEKSDFKVSLEQDILTISAEKKEEVKEENADNTTGRQIRREYSFRSFKRSFTIDEKIDGSAIEAQYVNGVLTLNLPKKETVKEVKQINIR
jgi:HSP20 family protein